MIYSSIDALLKERVVKATVQNYILCFLTGCLALDLSRYLLLLVYYLVKMAPTRTWQEVAKEAQLHRDASIAKVNPPVPEVPADLPLDVTPLPRKLLSEREVEITETPAESLLASLATGKLTSVEVTNAFLRRAGLAQKLVGGSRWLRFDNMFCPGLILMWLTGQLCH